MPWTFPPATPVCCGRNSTIHYTRILDSGVEQDCFIRSADGTLVETSTMNGTISTWGNHYSVVMEFQLPLSTYREVLCGNLETQPRMLPLGDHIESVLFPGKGTALVQDETEEGLSLVLYNLENGDQLASYLRSNWDMAFTSASFDGRNLWLYSGDSPTFCRLDITAQTGISGQLETLYTLSNPAPLDEAKALAQEIANNFGVGIELKSADNRTTGINYDSWPDYRPQEFAAALKTLQAQMETFPAGFFQRLGPISIRLVDTFDPAQGIPASTGDMLIGNTNVIELSIGTNMLEVFYHELFHAMELYITGESKILSKWETLNPEGFSYSGSYTDYREGKLAESPFLEAVADDYGLISTREDRAQIFMYAMMEGQAERFDSPILQQKLSSLCAAIRDAWNWKKSTDPLPWEQYLKTE